MRTRLSIRNHKHTGVFSSLSKWAVAVKTRDGFRCETCGAAEPETKAYNEPAFIQAHHVIPRHKGGENTLSNGITLCRRCHAKEHSGTGYAGYNRPPERVQKTISISLSPEMAQQLFDLCHQESLPMPRLVLSLLQDSLSARSQ